MENNNIPDKKELIFRKFPSREAGKLFTVPRDEEYLSNFSSPPFFSDQTEDEMATTRRLLSKKFESSHGETENRIEAEKALGGEDERDCDDASPEPVVGDSPHTFQDSRPLGKEVKIVLVCIVSLVMLVMMASRINSDKFYMKSNEGAIEIWKGRFAPKGSERFVFLPGAETPERIKEVYKKWEVYPFIYNYYIEMADTLLDAAGMPDFHRIRGYLNKAILYATPSNPPDEAHSRLKHIDLMILVYKADVEAAKGTERGIKTALGYLKEAASLEPEGVDAEMIKNKVMVYNATISKLEAGKKSKPDKSKKSAAGK